MKGEYNQECNRTACSNKNATFYNFSTLKYYCASCAKLINQHNHGDSLRLFGHELCIHQDTDVEPEVKHL